MKLTGLSPAVIAGREAGVSEAYRNKYLQSARYSASREDDVKTAKVFHRLFMYWVVRCRQLSQVSA